MVRKVIRRTVRRKVMIRYGRAAGPPAVVELLVTSDSSALPPWHGSKIKIEDVPNFAAKWGLVAVRGELSEGETCSKLYLVEMQQWQTIDGTPVSTSDEPSQANDAEQAFR